ncbi:MAG TPA: Hsp20/alpha crystallin family protein [Bacteroidales bacterium]|nr:Hsp20/alpha crystallin family protein [Bacteroidales bacterium]
MTLIKWSNRNNPISDMFSNFFDTDFVDYFNRRSIDPAANIIEHPDSFELNLAAPGMKKEDFKINLENNILTISSEIKEEESDDKKNFTRREFYYGSFSRSFTLPKTIDLEKIKADYETGLLKVMLPKREDERLDIRKEIKIS